MENANHSHLKSNSMSSLISHTSIAGVLLLLAMSSPQSF
jgi:hypothetical protein